MARKKTTKKSTETKPEAAATSTDGQVTRPDQGEQAAAADSKAPQVGTSDVPADKKPPAGQRPEAEAGADAKQTSLQVATAPASIKDAEPPLDERLLIVVGPSKGRWRCGLHFTPEPTALKMSELTPEQVRMLADDPKLMVSLHAPGK